MPGHGVAHSRRHSHICMATQLHNIVCIVAHELLWEVPTSDHGVAHSCVHSRTCVAVELGHSYRIVPQTRLQRLTRAMTTRQLARAPGQQMKLHIFNFQRVVWGGVTSENCMAWATNEVAHLTGRRQFGDGGTIEKNCMSTVYKKSCTSLSGSCTSTASQLHKTGTKLHTKKFVKTYPCGIQFQRAHREDFSGESES